MKSAQLPILIALLALLGGGAWFVMQTQPLQDQLAAAEENLVIERNFARARISEGELATKELDALRIKVETGEAQYQALLATLPTQRDVGGFLEEINTAAQTANATLTSLSPNADNTRLTNDVSTLAIRTSATGTYEEIRAFLIALENLHRFSRVTSIGFTVNAANPNNPQLTLDAQLITYLFTNPAGGRT